MKISVSLNLAKICVVFQVTCMVFPEDWTDLINCDITTPTHSTQPQ